MELQYNYSKLIGRIIEYYGTRNKFAEAIHMHPNTLSRKLRNDINFQSDEYVKMAKLLDISNEEYGAYFFTEKVR